jgi:acyl-CoA reductase-like NAD-dependent aldehyde dehydrogenase
MSSSSATFEKHNPCDDSVLGEFPITSKDDVDAAVARARAAFPAWRDLGIDKRLEILGRLKSVILEHGEEYARQISKDTGKPLVDSLVTELMMVPLFIDHYKKHAKSVLGREKVPGSIIFPGKKGYVEHFPMGVIGIISPWNFPFNLSAVPIISALIGGNTAVLKPSEITPLTGEVVRDAFGRIGLPEGVVEVVQGDGSTGAALVDAEIDKIFFTGSVATGRKVMEAAAKKPIPVELELGGKDAMIVCHDAPLERAAKAAVWGGFINCGQMCTSVERCFVVDSVYPQFVSAVEKEIRSLTYGSPEEGADIGPLTSPDQMAIVERHVEAARDAGATIVTGGKRANRGGQFYEPTLVLDVDTDMEIYREETFGPVLPVIRVRDEEEALSLANNHQYGLTGSVWTKDIKRGIELASRMESGQCSVNDLVQSVGNPALPFGGVKNSGFGRYHGAEGLRSFCHQKAIFVDRGWLKTEPFWFPYEGKFEPIRGVFKGLLKGNYFKAIAGLIKASRSSS